MAQPQASKEVDRAGRVPELPEPIGEPLGGDHGQRVQVDRVGEPLQVGEQPLASAARIPVRRGSGSAVVGDPDQPRDAGLVASVLLVIDPFVDRSRPVVPDWPRPDQPPRLRPGRSP